MPKLVLGTNNSVPVGTTDAEVEEIYQESFKPLLRVLYKHEKVSFTLHYSGHLLTWLERHHSEYIDVLLEMVQRRQVELLGGGFYDAILALIPRPDRIGQVESMTTLLRKRFRRRARGVWITGSVWDASLVGTLRSCGMEYAFLDDAMLRESGMSRSEICRPRLTEDQGKTLVVVPVCGELNEFAQNGKPEDAVRFIRGQSKDADSSVFSMIPDAQVYRDGGGRPRAGEARVSWLEGLLDLIEQSADDIQTVLPYQFLREYTPRDRCYFQSGLEHQRMLTQSADRNLMYAKMQYTHVLVNQIRGDKYRKQAAREELWRGQSHSAYWIDGESGLLNNRLRKEVYRSLIEAEKHTRERGIFSPAVVTVDFDMDGLIEYLYQGQAINAYVHSEGAQLFELDHLPVPWNYLDTIGNDNKRLGSESRKAFLDRFLDPNVTLGEFRSGDYPALRDFSGFPYNVEDFRREGKRLGFEASGSINGTDVRLHKQFSFKRAAVSVNYSIENAGETDLLAVFAPEINLSFRSQEADALRMFVDVPRGNHKEISPSAATHAKVKSVVMEDLANGLVLTLAPGGCDEIWVMPVEVDRESGRGKLYQGTCIVPRWNLAVEPGQTAEITISLSIE